MSDVKDVTVEGIINIAYANTTVFYMGQIQTENKQTNEYITYDLHACALESETRDYPVVLVLTRAKYNSEKITKLTDLKWTSIHVRSFSDIKKLKDLFQFDWNYLTKQKKQPSQYSKLPKGAWIDEIKEMRAKRTKSYKLKNQTPENVTHIITIETKEQNVEHGNRLKQEYEIDLCFIHRQDMVIEVLE